VDLIRFNLDGGGSVLVEVDEATASVARAGRIRDAEGRLLQVAGQTLEQGLANVRDAAAAALGQFQAMTRSPDEVEITFGVKLDAEVGAVIARTGVQGQLEVKLTWHNTADDTTKSVRNSQ
jgi:hypothetical protein